MKLIGYLVVQLGEPRRVCCWRDVPCTMGRRDDVCCPINGTRNHATGIYLDDRQGAQLLALSTTLSVSAALLRVLRWVVLTVANLASHLP